MIKGQDYSMRTVIKMKQKNRSVRVAYRNKYCLVRIENDKAFNSKCISIRPFKGKNDKRTGLLDENGYFLILDNVCCTPCQGQLHSWNSIRSTSTSPCRRSKKGLPSCTPARPYPAAVERKERKSPLTRGVMYKTFSQASYRTPERAWSNE